MKYIVYHGTNANFDKFSKDYLGIGNDDLGLGFYFAETIFQAEHYGKNILKCEITLKNPIMFDDTENQRDIKLKMSLQQTIDILKKHPDILDEDETPLWDIMDITGWDLEEAIEEVAKKYQGNWLGLNTDIFPNNDLEYREALRDILGIDGIIQTTPHGKIYVCWFPEQIKILKKEKIKETLCQRLNKTFKSLNERLEELENGIYATKNVYDIVNLLKNKPKEYRIIYDDWIDTYIIADSNKYIHEDLILKAYQQGCYAGCSEMDDFTNGLYLNKITITDFMAERFEDESFLRLIWVPKDKPIFLGSDDYDFAYNYEYGTMLSREGYWEDSELYKVMGKPLSMESSFDESLNERLEKMGNCFCTTNACDIVNLLKNKPKEYRILYDAKIGYYLIGEAEHFIHHQLMEKAFDEGLYYPVKDFMQNMCGGFDKYSLYSYQDLGIDGYYDGESDENFDPFLYYIVFSPNEEWELGTDGYNKRYDYPFGHVFTRGCDLSEIGLWDALGVPQNSEKLNETYELPANKIVIGYRGVDKEIKKNYSKPQWFSENKEIARSYGDVIYKATLKLNNPLDLTNPKNNMLFKDYFEVTDEKIEQKFQKIFNLMNTIEGKEYDKQLILNQKQLLYNKEYKKFADFICDNSWRLRTDIYNKDDAGCQIGKIAKEIFNDICQKEDRTKMLKGELPFFSDWCYSHWDEIIKFAKTKGYDSIINMEEDNYKQFTDIGFVVWDKQNIISLEKDEDFRENINIYKRLNQFLEEYI